MSQAGAGSGTKESEQEKHPVDFEAVRQAEQQQLGYPDNKATGLAFSGGGIRSATFNLGVIQALSELNLLRRFDYLSTVSGGGYIGSWLSGLIHGDRQAATKPCNGKNEANKPASMRLEELEKKLAPGNDADPHDKEADEIQFLRSYSNYLTPKAGLFSADTWTGITTYVRNLILNQSILIATLAVVLLLPRLLVDWSGLIDYCEPMYASRYYPLWLLLLLFAVLGMALNYCLGTTPPEDATMPENGWQKLAAWAPLPTLLLLLVVAYWGGFLILSDAQLGQTITILGFSSTRSDLILGIALALGGLMVFLSYKHSDLNATFKKHSDLNATLKMLPRAVSALLSATPIFAMLAFLTAAWIGCMMAYKYFQPVNPVLIDSTTGMIDVKHITVWGTPLVLSVAGLVIVFSLGLLGRSLNDPAREWWSRLGAWLSILVVVFTGLGIVSIYGPDLLRWLWSQLRVVAAGLSLTWVITTVVGIKSARSATTGKPGEPSMLDRLVKLTPYVFIIGLLFLLSLGLDELLSHYVHNTFLLTLICATFALFFSWRVDINLFSFHMFYRNRLVRCYLGASNFKKRQPHSFTGFDENDNIELAQLSAQRPYHLVNTTLNLTTGEKLAWQERMAASFLMSPLYCGYQLEDKPGSGCYQKTAHFATESWSQKPVTLGGAMAISGAAASPNQGYHSSLPVAFLLTLFNVRLGWWLANPRSSELWRKASNGWGLYYLLKELFGMADDQSRHVYVSDGGHFENLGIYELVRRKCRIIIASDAGQDGDFSFEDLGNAVRKCYVDLGIRIELDTSALMPRGNSSSDASRDTWHSPQHCAIGLIRYDLAWPGAVPGIIIYIKPSLSGDEPVDIQRYAAVHPDFPHETTVDQWFEESQFESYRKLGYHIASSVLKPAIGREGSSHINLEQLATALQQRWFPPAAKTILAGSQRAEELERIRCTIRTNPRLRFLDEQIYAEYRQIPRPDSLHGALWHTTADSSVTLPQPEYWIPKNETQLRESFYVCNAMIQLMENVYNDLDLEQFHAHPDNRGWMNLYKRWSWSGMFRLTWAICVGTYGARFQGFCERQLGLKQGAITIKPGNDKKGLGNAVTLHASLEESEAWNILHRKELGTNYIEARLIPKIIDAWCKLKRVDSHSTPAFRVYSFRMVVESPYKDPGKPTDSLPDAVFPFGFALACEYASNDNPAVKVQRLIYFRVRDHVRKQGLGGKALQQLLLEMPRMSCSTKELQDDMVMLPRDEANPDPETSRRSFIRLFGSLA